MDNSAISTDRSEYYVAPPRILLHHPRHGLAYEGLLDSHLEQHNFIGLPEAEAFYAEYDAFADTLGETCEPLFLSDILSDDVAFAEESRANPNLIFMRDSSVTLPWSPKVFIPTRPALPSRNRESQIVGRALERLGLSAATQLEGDEYLEGGDVLPVTFAGKRVLLVGFGVRTTKAAAIRLALDLIPHHVDQIIGLSHDADLLHLDTGFTVLPNKVILAATGMFSTGFIIDEERRLARVNPIAYAQERGFSIIQVDKADAIAQERCNLLPLGQGRYVAFDMPEELRYALEAAAGISIKVVRGVEIAKATGGVHCLTRPLYF